MKTTLFCQVIAAAAVFSVASVTMAGPDAGCFVVGADGLIHAGGKKVSGDDVAKGVSGEFWKLNWLPVYVNPDVKWKDFLAAMRPLIAKYGENAYEVEFFATPNGDVGDPENISFEQIVFRRPKVNESLIKPDDLQVHVRGSDEVEYHKFKDLVTLTELVKFMERFGAAQGMAGVSASWHLAATGETKFRHILPVLGAVAKYRKQENSPLVLVTRENPDPDGNPPVSRIPKRKPYIPPPSPR